MSDYVTFHVTIDDIFCFLGGIELFLVLSVFCFH